MKQYKIIKVDFDIKYEKAETLMNEMSEKGWEVVCINPEPIDSLKMMITFCRDISESDKEK